MRILSVRRGSPAWRAGLRAGDDVITAGGHELGDVIDLRYYTYDALLTLRVISPRGEERTVTVRKGEGEDMGADFGDCLLEGARRCANRCVFCFIDQLPPGMRDSLYFKDDDLPMSFMLGNYITLTNLSERDIARVLKMRISPVNVSVHASDPEIRRRMLGNPRAGECMSIMRRLAGAHIEMNCQIVLCPGYNDGAVLERTLDDLVSLYPAVPSVSVVPVGLTRWRDGLPPLRAVEREDALAALETAGRVGERCLRQFGTRIVYCADELWQKADLPIPGHEYFEEFPQIENGVGLIASFRSEAQAAIRGLIKKPSISPFSIATGTAAYDLISETVELFLASCDNRDCPHMVYEIKNRFFGESVTVAGLITGGDILTQLRDRPLHGRLLISETMLRAGESVFLDDMTLDELSASLGVPVIPVRSDGAAFINALMGKDKKSGRRRS